MPLLSTFGATSNKGFGFGRVGAGGSIFSYGYFDVEYGGWTGDAINADPTNAGTPYTGTASDVYDGLDMAIDWSTGKAYAAYNTVSQYTGFPYAGTGSTYAGNDNYYRFSGSRSDISGHSSSGIAASGRGMALGYLNDVSRTAVLMVGHVNDTHSGGTGGGIFFFQLSNGSFLGRMYYSHPSETLTDLSGVAWDGTHILAVCRTRSGTGGAFGADTGILTRLIMPSSISSNGNLTVDQHIEIPHKVFYGMHWGGWTTATSGTLYITDNNNANNVSQFSFNWATGTSALVGARGKYVSADANYGLTLDTKNRRLVVGGYSTHTIDSFGE